MILLLISNTRTTTRRIDERKKPSAVEIATASVWLGLSIASMGEMKQNIVAANAL